MKFLDIFCRKILQHITIVFVLFLWCCRVIV